MTITSGSVSRNRDGTSVDPAPAHHEIAGHQMRKVVLAVVLGHAGDAADLAERLLVEQLLDALACGKAAAIVLAFHLVGAAHLARHLLAAAQLVHFRLPGHDGVSSRALASTIPSIRFSS